MDGERTADGSNIRMSYYGRSTAAAQYTEIICYPSQQITSHGMWYARSPLHFTFPILLMQVSAAIIVSRLIKILLRPLRQPTIVSDLLGGLLLGPSVLGQFPKIHAALFPDSSVFIWKTLARFAIIYHVFSIGVKVNFRLLSKSRNAATIGMLTLFVPYITVAVLSFLLRKYTVNDFAGGLFILSLAAGTSVTAFAVIFPLLAEFRFLNTELGRISLSIAALQDGFGLLATTFVNLDRSGNVDFEATFYRCGTMVFVIILSFLIIRPMLFWVIQRTPKGTQVEEGYIVAILLGALLMAIASHLLGMTIVQGSIIFGLAIPDGPPLGSAVTEKIDTIDRMLFQPIFYAGIGQRVNVFAHSSWSADGCLFLILLSNRLAKLLGALLPAMACRIPFRDALSLGLLLNAKGFINFVNVQQWDEAGLLSPQTTAILVISALITTMIAAPIFTWLMSKSRRYMSYERRTVQHSELGVELNVLACVLDQESVGPMLNLMEVTNATRERPIIIHVLHLVELVGRATPILIAHKPHNNAVPLASYSATDVFSAFRSYARHRDGLVALHLYTSISPSKTMHEDVCSVARQKRVSLIIVPFHKHDAVPVVSFVTNPSILAHAPCSVGILVDRSELRTRFSWTTLGTSLYRVGVIFLGGPDDREALSYASRMVEHPCVVLNVLRFVSIDQKGQNPKEKQLDDDLVNEFLLRWTDCKKVMYKEELVHDSEETMSVIRLMDGVYDLMVVGRHQASNANLLQGLSTWIESPELGVIGDLCSSSDFLGGGVSVLVMQQQATTTADTGKPKIFQHVVLQEPAFSLSKI
ncbi:hypothetical protein ACLOJK_031368 [Asimina triloba]